MRPLEELAITCEIQGKKVDCSAIITSILSICSKILDEDSTDLIPDDQSQDEEEDESAYKLLNPENILQAMQTKVEMLFILQRMQFADKEFQTALETAESLVELQKKVVKIPIANKLNESSELANF